MNKSITTLRLLIAAVVFLVPVLHAQLSGTKTIGGTTPDYLTIKEAVKALNDSGVQAPGVTFLIRDGIYTEDSLRIRTSSSNVNAPIVFRPDSAAQVVINVTPPSSAYNFGIAVDTTQYVTITGQPLHGLAGDRNLTLNVVGTNGLVGIRVVNNSDYCVIKNLVIATASKINTNSRAIYVYGSGSSVWKNPNYALIENNYVKRTYTGIRVQGMDVPNFIKGPQVINNQIATSTGDSVGAIGISVTSSDGARIFNNMVGNILPPATGGATTLYGMTIEGYTQSALVYHNTVSQMRGAAASTNVYGLYVNNSINSTLATADASGNKIFNNLVYDIDGLGSGTGIIAGIYVTNSFGYDSLYHNSVLLTGTSSGQRISAALYYNTSGGTNLLLRNNNLVNRRTEAGGLNSFAAGLYVGNSNGSVLNSDHNNFYPGTGGDTTYCAAVWRIANGYYRKFSTLGGSQYEFGNDVNSVVENAPYISDTDLHLTAASTSQLEAAGAQIPPFASLDFDGVARNASTPDIGAFDAAMTPVDGMPPVFTSFVPLLPAPREGTRTVTITINDRSGLAVGANAPRLLWKKSTDPTYTSVAHDAVQNGIFTFSIPEQPVRTVVQYYFVAQDASPAANVATLPSLGTSVAAPPVTFSYLVQDPISGVKTVGGLSPDYVTLKAAIHDINAQDVVPPGVTLLIRSGIYNEDSLRIYTRKSNASAPITIRPDSAATVVINVTPPNTTYNFGLAVDSTQSVTISGQPLYGADTARNMTVNVLGTNGLVGVRVVGHSPNAVIKNLIITTNAALTNSSGKGILVTYGVISQKYGLPHYALIENNYITRAYSGISVNGANNTNYISAPRILNNSIGTGAADLIGANGIDLSNADSMIVSKNIIRNIIPPAGGSTNVYGIRVGTECNWADINTNDISHIRGISASGSTSGLYIGNTQTKGNSRYVNNVISDVEGLTTGTGVTAGIYVVNTSTTVPETLYHNSVLLTGASTGSRISAALAIVPFSSGYQLYLRNNSFVNRRTEVLGLNSFAAGMYVGYYPQVINSDHNNFFGGYAVDSSHLAIAYKMNTSAPFYYRKFSALGGWQYEFKNDLHSVVENVPYISASDLHLSPSSVTQLESNGTPIGIAKDFDGNIRNALTPDIGAFEGTYTQIDSMPPIFIYAALPPAPTTGARVVHVTISDPSGIGVAGNAPMLWHKIKDSVSYSSVGIDSANGTEYFFTLPGRSNNTTVQYYFSAKDAAVAQNFATWPPMGTVNTPPPAVFSYLVQSPLAAGTYTVGAEKDFPTLDSIMLKISQDGVAGGVTAVLTDTLYTLTKLVTLSGPINGTNQANRILITPETGKNV
ncbi:MAG: hypothetical protein M0R68_07915, partial [Bacteroidetes bacterium]|nr:hypothetical protein [Bacteroidota bacterium]